MEPVAAQNGARNPGHQPKAIATERRPHQPRAARIGRTLATLSSRILHDCGQETVKDSSRLNRHGFKPGVGVPIECRFEAIVVASANLH